jgi:hypothetical protein
MNPTRTKFEVTSATWPARVLAVLAALHGWGASAQETNAANPGSLLPANQLVRASSLAPTNSLAATNQPAPTNGVAPLEGLSLTNSLSPTNSSAPDTNVTTAASEPVPEEYAPFRVIADRNIFNPNRTRGGRWDPRETRKQARFEAFSLVGTMSYQERQLAFFNGTSSDYRKVLRTNDIIVGYRLTDITHNSVKLGSATNELEMRMGMQMRKEDRGDWFLATTAEPASYSATGASSEPSSDSRPEPSRPSRSFDSGRGASRGAMSSPAPSTPSSPAASTGNESETLKKLIQRREQELNR